MIKQIALIIAQEGFQDKELADTRSALVKRGVKVKVAAKTRYKAISKTGQAFEPDLALAEIRPENFAAVAFIGGPGATSYFDDDNALNLAREFKAQGKVVGAICIAPTILANAGVLIGKTVTAFPTEEVNLRDKGADYTGMPVEVDSNIVTAKNPEAASDFGQRLADLLN